MNCKMIRNALIPQMLIIYFAAFLLLSATATEQASLLNLLGGFSVSGSMMLNVLEIIRWNICVLPPVSASIVFMTVELGPLCTYTMLRAKKLKGWYGERLATIIAVNLAYIAVFSVLTAVFGWNVECHFPALCRLAFAFPLHTTLVSMLSVTLLILYRSPRVSFMAYFVIEVGLVIAGFLFPQASKGLIPFWGMVKNDELLWANTACHLLITTGMSLFAISLLIFATMKWLAHNNPAANPQSI